MDRNDDLAAALRRIRGKARTGVVGNAWPGTGARLIAAGGDVADLWVMSCDVGHARPDPRIFEIALALHRDTASTIAAIERFVGADCPLVIHAGGSFTPRSRPPRAALSTRARRVLVASTGEHGAVQGDPAPRCRRWRSTRGEPGTTPGEISALRRHRSAWRVVERLPGATCARHGPMPLAARRAPAFAIEHRGDMDHVLQSAPSVRFWKEEYRGNSR